MKIIQITCIPKTTQITRIKKKLIPFGEKIVPLNRKIENYLRQNKKKKRKDVKREEKLPRSKG